MPEIVPKGNNRCLKIFVCFLWLNIRFESKFHYFGNRREDFAFNVFKDNYYFCFALFTKT